tara:strand:+ start:853 stop:2250 length:1398 start_codon:yes stop_codon:yes gene_type:complete
MLGFSQYSQVSYVAIIEQKIRVFLLAVFTVNPRMTSLVLPDANGPIQSAGNDLLFNLFVQSLKDKNIYEEYLIPSVFIEDINYDYITNEDSTTFQIAEENLKNAFFRVLKEVLGDGKPDPQNNEKSLTTFLGVLFSTGKIRDIPPYEKKEGVFLDMSFLGAPKKINQLFEGSSLKDENVFYLETFFRIRDEVAANLSEEQIIKGQFLNETELFDFDKINKLDGGPSDNFTKGIRLMMNLTSVIEYTQFGEPATNPAGTNTSLPVYNKTSLQKLPFLNIEFLKKLSGTCLFDRNNRNYFELPLFNAFKPVPNVIPPQTVGVKKEQVIKDVKAVIEFIRDQADNKPSFINSKTLVCVEELTGNAAGGKINEKLAVYFPISMSEFVSDKFSVTDSELAHELANTTTYNEFFVTPNFTEFLAILQILIKFTTINAVDFFNAADDSAIKSQNEALDNMITNLINFDEVNN